MSSLSGSPLERFVDWLIRWRIVLLIGAALLTVAAAVPASRLAFDQSVESMFASDNPRLRDYLHSKMLFGGDEFVILSYTDPDLFLPGKDELSPEAEQRLRKLSDDLSKVPGVLPGTTQDMSSALATARFPFLARRRSRIIEMFRGFLLGDDNQTTAVVLRIAPQSMAPVPRSETIGLIREIAERQTLRTYVVGEPVQVFDMFQYVEDDGMILGLASSALLFVVILIFFRSLRWVILPIAVVQVTLLWTRAILVLSQLKLSMVSSMLTSLVTIIGVATVIHVTVNFREFREKHDRESALRLTLIALLPAIFWTCATTAGGFAAQLTSHIHPVRSFGLMMGLASMLVLLVTIVLIPGGVLWGRWGIDPRAAPAEDWLSRSLDRLSDWLERHPRRVALVAFGSLLVACLGFFWLRVETDFSKNFRASSPIVQSLDFFETHLGGAGTWEVNFPAPKELDNDYLERIRRLADELRKLPVTKVVAVTDGIDLIPRIPFISRDIEGQMNVLDRFQPEFIPSLYNANAGRMRIILRARERQPSEEKLQLIADVEATARQEFADAEPGQEARASGLFVLLTFLIESLLGDQWVSFVVAAGGLMALMSIAYRSLAIGFIALVPNVLPIVIVIGTMGWIGLPINIATAMIASVSMGLTVDSSIHYLSGFRRARLQGHDFYGALRQTHQGVGRALIYANIALVTGFLVLTLSQFIPLVYFGILVGVAMLGGLAGNLILLPLLMQTIPLGGVFRVTEPAGSRENEETTGNEPDRALSEG